VRQTIAPLTGARLFARPEANDDLVKENFYAEMADAKNAPASGVG
jgi:hypothetical protein